jgi:hypothetical protein
MPTQLPTGSRSAATKKLPLRHGQQAFEKILASVNRIFESLDLRIG